MRWGFVWMGLIAAAGCAAVGSSSGEAPHFGYFSDTDTRVWVSGPWEAIRPSHDPDEVIDQLCPEILKLHLARERDYGLEYCGAIYEMEDGVFYASHPSTLGETTLVGPSKRRSCRPPREIRDSRGSPTRILADFHSHPWVRSPMSFEDLSLDRQLYSIRIQFDAGCRLQKLVPYQADPLHPGEVFERRDRAWRLIGIIKPENKTRGLITPVN